MFDTFIRRPVLAVVVSLLIFFVGLYSLSSLQVRQYPELENTSISITTTFPGADAELMQGFVTQPIEKSVASAEGVDYITSRSAQGISVVTVAVPLNYDGNAAMTNVTAKVNAVRAQLPSDINDPVLVKSTGQSFAAAYIAFSSPNLSQEQITEYLTRVVQPRLSVVPGVASSDILGSRTFAMRVWLDPRKLAQYKLTAGEVVSAMQANNYSAAAGTTKGYFDVISNRALTDATSEDEFRRLVVRNDGRELVRLGDVADIELGSQSADSSVVVEGNEAVFIGIQVASDANSIDVVAAVKEELPRIQRDLPEGLNSQMVYDSTTFITSSIEEVMMTVAEAAIIVIVVIFLFLGSFRSVAIPIVTIPLSLIGVGTALFALGFSINLMTLLAMVLAIGLVVDDAIVVVENIHRHIEEGLTPFQAAIKGTREIAAPVISMTITLAAVYTPIALMGGLTGALFSEFALTLAGAVIVSGIVALTLSPMMSSRILKHSEGRGGFAGWLDRRFAAVQRRYGKMLRGSLNDRFTTIVFALLVIASIGWLFPQIQQELAPEEDQGALLTMFNGPSKANIDYMNHYAADVRDAFSVVPEASTVFTITGLDNTTSRGIGIGVLTPWEERESGARQLSGAIQGELNKIPGVTGSVFSPPALPSTGGGYPVSFVVQTTADYRQLAQVTEDLLAAARQSGQFLFVDSDLKYDSPQTVIHIDREKTGALGVTMRDVATTLATMAGGNYVNLINITGRAYQVIPQAPRTERLTPQDLGGYYVRAASGAMVPLSSVVTLEHDVVPASLNRFNQLNSATISGVPMIGLTTGDAIAFLQEQAETLPAGFSVDYSGQSRQEIQEGSKLYMTFGFALVIIYLVLAAQYESLRDPLVILVSVPLSIVGALIPLAMGISSLNIYSQIGLVTLIGLITKHGILICEVAREQQELHGKSRMEAVEIAAQLRLRPVLMTTAAMVAGLIPMLLAQGAGAASRMSISLVIVAGMSIGTLFTLFVLPVIYTFLASDRAGTAERKKREEEAIREVEAQEAATQAG
ncbi:efflux RND transporter permease subunit [Lutibaculum baratangense]|uniref:RND multidrug efflux transporter n=1 Tax=Lutibaculum baratangense AMV1 TaxID=631454 RepID=V4RSY9_9HYPH|nr:efflux RND transporter permease subunit [Lutibaculum baratangense]ESR26245.1 RND multidrug efflux transporter [Lutibaculum baratangense AMV1]